MHRCPRAKPVCRGAQGGLPKSTRRSRWVAAAVTALVAATACDGQAAPPADDAPAQVVQYVVVPHPDDEYQAWGLVTGREDAYPVFILLTRGETTSRCAGSGFQPEHGERAPQPQPFKPGDRDRCADQRLDAWHAFLDGMGELEDHLEPDPPHVGSRDGAVEPAGVVPSHPDRDEPAAGYDLWVADDHARVAFDLGDGALQPDEVVWAVEEVRRQTADGTFPVTAEGDVVGASFANPDGHPDCVAYSHPDHVAVDDALWEHDLDVPGAQHNRVCATDPRVDEDGTATAVPEELHAAIWAVDPEPVDPAGNPDAERVGVAQRVYGWLAFSFAEEAVHTYWEVSDHEADTIFSRQQHFWTRYGR